MSGPSRALPRRSALLFLIGVGGLAAITAAASAGPPPPTGDWVVSDATQLSSQSIDISANVWIYSGGSLELTDVDLRVNSTYPGEFGIFVQPGGTLNITRGLVSSGDPNNTYRFEIRGSSHIDSAVVERMWGSPTADTFGVQIYSTTVLIENTTIQYGARGNVLVSSGSPTLRNNTIRFAIPMLVSEAVSNNCYITRQNEATGVRVANGSSPWLVGNDVRQNPVSFVPDPTPDVKGRLWSNLTCPSYFSIQEYFLGWGLVVQSSAIEASNNTFQLNSIVPNPDPYCVYDNGTQFCTYRWPGEPGTQFRPAAGVTLRAAAGNFTDNVAYGNWLAGVAVSAGTVAISGGSIRNHIGSYSYSYIGERNAGLLFLGPGTVQGVNMTGNLLPVGLVGVGKAYLRGIYATYSPGVIAIRAADASAIVLEVWDSSLVGFTRSAILGYASGTEVRFYNCSLGTATIDGYTGYGIGEMYSWLDFGAKWLNGAAIAGGQARLQNTNGLVLFNGTLDGLGRGPPGWLVTYGRDFVHSNIYGNGTLRLRVDMNGVNSPEDSFSFSTNLIHTLVVEDPVAPLVSIFSPVDNGSVSGIGLTIRGSAVDLGSGVVRISASADGGNLWVDADPPFDSWQLRLPLSDGTYDIFVRVDDLAGNYGSAIVRSVVIDSVPPTLQLLEPQPPTSGAPIIYTPLTALQFRGTAEDGATVDLGGQALPTAGGYFSLQVTLLTGANFFHLSATDRAGNIARIEFEVVSDAVPPVLLLLSPSDGLVTQRSPYLFEGRTEPDAALTINGEEVPSVGGAFSTYVYLERGLQFVWVNATDPAGNRNAVRVRITYDIVPPHIVITAPAPDFLTRESTIDVSGTVDADIAEVLVNGVVTRTAGGAFSVSTKLSEGNNTITVSARDAAGNEANASTTVRRDAQPPTITLTSPAEGAFINFTTVVVEGNVGDAVTLLVQGELVEFTEGNFSVNLGINEGSIELVVVAVDQAGNVATLRRHVTRDTTPPSVAIALPLPSAVLDEPSVAVRGSASGAEHVWVDGREVALDAAGNFTVFVDLSRGSNEIVVRGKDLAGNEVTIKRFVTYEPPRAPEPAGLFGLGAASYALLPLFALVGAGSILLWQRRKKAGP